MSIALLLMAVYHNSIAVPLLMDISFSPLHFTIPQKYAMLTGPVDVYFSNTNVSLG